MACRVLKKGTGTERRPVNSIRTKRRLGASPLFRRPVTSSFFVPCPRPLLPASVPLKRRIDLHRPSVDSAGHALGLWKTILPQPIGGSETSAAVVAMDHDPRIAMAPRTRRRAAEILASESAPPRRSAPAHIHPARGNRRAANHRRHPEPPEPRGNRSRSAKRASGGVMVSSIIEKRVGSKSWPQRRFSISPCQRVAPASAPTGLRQLA